MDKRRHEGAARADGKDTRPIHLQRHQTDTIVKNKNCTLQSAVLFSLKIVTAFAPATYYVEKSKKGGKTLCAIFLAVHPAPGC